MRVFGLVSVGSLYPRIKFRLNTSNRTTHFGRKRFHPNKRGTKWKLIVGQTHLNNHSAYLKFGLKEPLEAEFFWLKRVLLTPASIPGGL